jgi:hypothetical protein
VGGRRRTRVGPVEAEAPTPRPRAAVPPQGHRRPPGGTLGAPLVNGVARLARGELDFYQINLALRDLTAEARLIDNGFVLRSSGRAGEGRIAADAELVWRDRERDFGQDPLRAHLEQHHRAGR